MPARPSGSIGFYPNIQGGRGRLELNLDAKGAADKSGVLTVEDFRVLGDPIVSEVYSSASSGGPAIGTTPQGQRRVVREVFEFDRMKVPFSAGHGQFVLEESYVKGPIIGASIRGKVDYASQRVNLGRHLRAPAGDQQRALRHSPLRTDRRRPRMRRRVRHHLCHSGPDVAAAGDRQSSVDVHAGDPARHHGDDQPQPEGPAARGAPESAR